MIQQQRTLSKTKAFILSLPDGGERIFRSYGIDTGTNAKQELPIGGKGGVFSDYDGVIRVHRFSTGEKFDVVGLVMNAERCDYRAARDRIAAHYNTTAAKIQESASQMLTTGRNDNKAPITIGQKRSVPISRVLAEIRFREYTQSEREYLSSKTAGIITPEALQSFGVRGVDMVHEITAEGKDHKQTSLAHYFAFPSGTRGYTKLVTPKLTTRDGERIKSSFVTNVEGYAERSGGKGYAFGLNEITGATSAAIIAEGEWETCILKSLGFDAFTKGGVDSCAKLTEHEIGILRAKNITRVVALFDNDHAGHTAAATFTKQRIAGIECIAVVWPCGEHVKDLCDYVQLFGFDERIRTAIDSALTMQTPDRFTFTRRGVTIEAQSYKVDRYVSEVSNDIDTQLRRRKRIVLSAPTGSGKTTLALNLAQDYHRRTGKRAAIVLPTQIGVAQLTNDAARARDVAGNEWHVETIGVSSAEGFDELARSRAFAAKVIVSTYDSIDTIGEDIGFLVIDEGHTFAGDYSYRPKAIEKVFTAMSIEHVEQILGLSATPETLFCKMYGFDVIRCTAAEQVRYDISFSTYESDNALSKIQGAKVSRRDSLISH
ncbi:MAG: DEAD/DEAH box helicase, partial [Candidatus Kapaibacterium sp.]